MKRALSAASRPYPPCTAAFVCQPLVGGLLARCARGRGGEGRVGSTSKRAADHDHVCRRSLQHFAAIVSFDAAAEGYSWGRGLVPRRIISGRLQLTPVKTSLVAFAPFLGVF